MSVAGIITNLGLISVNGETRYQYPIPAPASVNLPARIINYTGTNDWEWVTFGKLAAVYHTIEDTYLLRPVSQGLSLAEAKADLVTFVDLYLRAMKTNALLSSGIYVFDVAVEVTELEYPEAAGVYYHAAIFNLTIKESI